MKKNKGFAVYAIVLIVIVLLVIAGGIYFLNNEEARNVGGSLEYTPEALPVPYISAQENWPPLIQDSKTTYSCTPLVTEMVKITEKFIKNIKYCVKLNSEGAAGSTYNTYTYIMSSGVGTRTANFTLKYQNCGVYNDNSSTGGIEYNLCKKTQADFNSNIDEIIYNLSLENKNN